MDATEIRESFIRYFEKHEHHRVVSSPLVPQNDPTLMFTNAGMVPFKDVFVGEEKRPYSRAVSSQKCVRISGKHNDLENVGVTARHHTFFEMLGNFSFGDYFKDRAIELAWDFVTRELKLAPSRLLVTVFGGEGDLHADEEAERIWLSQGVPRERIIRCGAKDNFWQMGDTGPCGPCSEIHYWTGGDELRISEFGGDPSDDGIGWTEIWNLVFMQFNRLDDGRLEPLPAPSIDTGMGLERLAAVLQGVRSNYDTDLFRPLLDLTAEIAGKKYGGTQSADDVSMRVVADHARMAAFLIAEGIFPDRDGRPYVLRRVMRRAVRHGHRLGISAPFFDRCALKVVEIMGDSYPELRDQRALIQSIAHDEEVRFRRTLEKGLTLLEDAERWEQRADGRAYLPGATAFLLYDTYGFPVDLQQTIAQERGGSVDVEGFEKHLEAARERSAGSKVGSAAINQVYKRLGVELPSTEFVGYEVMQSESTVLTLLSDGHVVDKLSQGERGEMIVDGSPFYAESGGQVGERGQVEAAGVVASVLDTRQPVGGLSVHVIEVEQGEIRKGQKVELRVDRSFREASRRNHSATHLLHYALRSVLGDQATQKGSLVGPDRLRFDFSGSRPLTQGEILAIEDAVNEAILENAEIQTTVLPIDEAKRRGAIGIFEEKYGETVRMLRVGPSLELCGGLHARRTGDIGYFRILSQAGVAAGVRRIEAATGAKAIESARASDQLLAQLESVFKSDRFGLLERASRAVEEVREKSREIESLQRRLLSDERMDFASAAREVNGVRLLGCKVPVGDAKALRELADQLRDKMSPAVVLLGAEAEGRKALLVCSVSKEVSDRYHAGRIVKVAAALVGGKGGGRPDFAQAGGTDPGSLDQAVKSVYETP